ncbi:hypothetical protein QFC19_007121 [Naganishia cerealis]|uniref:Uncharacterized protein n=1 Tax=Naganishia cerealis TaxID=610337 RepID=A0ACC2VBP3_9TREE|nr:hypothetical protein QFC19_007121 [Naganishia cerealis]
MGRKRPSAKQRPSVQNGNWATMDPDEVFKRLHVAEVKKVESQLKATADGKQAELRTMVSERYRDLLLSTTQIASIHDSSLKLSRTLSHIEALCSKPGPTTPTHKDVEAASEEDNDGILLLRAGKNKGLSTVSLQRKREEIQELGGDSVMRQLPSAAAVKLLLDAPETIYRMLSTRSYLEAAFLWLLARTVKEYMLSPQQESLNEEYNNVYTPLVQKQWETLVPLRGQVVLKATSSMRDLKRSLRPGQEQDRITFIRILLAVMLLDSNTASDVLNIFLGQRSRAIEDIFTTSQLIRPNVSFAGNAYNVEKQGVTTPAARTKIRHTRQASRLDAAQVLRELSPAPPGAKGPIAQSGFAEGVKLDKKNIKRKIIRDRISKALLDTVKCIASTVGITKSTFLTRRDDPSGPSLFEDAVHRVQQGERMASTAQRQQALQRASLPIPSERASGLPSTSPIATASIPSPYISTSSMLKTLPSSQMLLTYLPDTVQMFTPFISSDARSREEKHEQITNKLDTWVSDTLQELAPRIEIWMGRLDSIADIWKVRSQLLRLLDDILPNESIALSAEQVDRIRKATQAAFETRTKALWRLLLDELVKTTTSGLEDSLEKIKSHDDSSITGYDLAKIYNTELRNAVRDIVQLLWKMLRDIGEKTSSDPIAVDQSMFIGRFALHMLNLEVLSSASGPVDLIDDGTRKELRDVYAQSTLAWKERTLEDALQIFRKSFEMLESEEDTEICPSVFNALTDIAAAILDSGVINPYSAELQKQIAVEFANRAKLVWQETDRKNQPDTRVKDMALLSYIAGTATTEQV